ncbi:circularly permuted type 2 ATP-grasp protein [Salinispirillum marinum]|uniref:Circularly permuted type 2 ATP-grasp protein n=2 Tax=Saccharospirillaceae TaxID=255527 RepID=A0ABV8B9K9_9GAMM
MPKSSLTSEELRQLLHEYQVPDDCHNELFSPDGHLRSGWSWVMDDIADIGLDGLAQQADEAQHLLHENGATFNVHKDEPQRIRSWALDPIPYIIATEEWAELEQGLAQRSRLLEALVDDLYGPRRVIEEGLLPAELVFSHPSFLFSAVGDALTAEQRPMLILHGMDVVRDAAGAWRILSDLVQAPTGSGYALENRIILARALPRLYREAPLCRLAGFLQIQHRTLLELAQTPREEPNIVLLTPGPGSAGYFEHAWLANYMNFSLVEGGDLVVRDGQVAMRSLGGLKRVDVIVRHITDPWCDPLELRGDSLLGVPGLMQAARRGEVEIANTLGVGVLEHPALAGFLPSLCEFLLQEPLLLRGKDTRWCGDDQQCQDVTRQLSDWQIQHVHEPQNVIDPRQMDSTERAKLNQELCENGHLYTASKALQPSMAPCFNRANATIEAHAVYLRFFTLTDPEDMRKPALERAFRVMPGGLAWVSDHAETLIDSDLVKDIWVLAPVPQPHISMLQHAHKPIIATRDGEDLPTRVAESLFWMGRYGERLDNRARLLRESLTHLLEYGQRNLAESVISDLFVALRINLQDVHNLQSMESRKSPKAMVGKTNPQFLLMRKQLLALLSEEAPDNLPWLFSLLLRNGRAARAHLGDDAWRTLNTLRQKLEEQTRSPGATSARRSLEEVITYLAAFFGLCNETMPHHYGWRFMDIGRFIDRLQSTLDLLRLALVSSTRPGIPLWEVVLASTDNLTAYRRRYRSQLYPIAILDLLLFDETNPRSVGYMLKRLGRQIERLPNQTGTPFRSREARLVIEATSRLHLVAPESLSELDHSEEALAVLAQLLTDLMEPISALSDAISHSHFSHAETPRQLVNVQGGV